MQQLRAEVRKAIILIVTLGHLILFRHSHYEDLLGLIRGHQTGILILGVKFYALVEELVRRLLLREVGSFLNEVLEEPCVHKLGQKGVAFFLVVVLEEAINIEGLFEIAFAPLLLDLDELPVARYELDVEFEEDVAKPIEVNLLLRLGVVEEVLSVHLVGMIRPQEIGLG